MATIRVTDRLGQVVSQTTYDKSGRTSRITDARGIVTRLGYDAANRVILRHIDPSGLRLNTRYVFDAFGQQITATEGADTSAARVTAYQYDRKGQLVQTILDPNGLKLSTRYSFDGLGNTVKVEHGTTSSPSQRVTLVEFDQLGRRIKEIVAPSAVFGPGLPNTRDLTTEQRYDAAGRLSCTIHPDGTRTWPVYDAAGQHIQTINAMGEVSESVYDANGRVVQSRRYFNRLRAEDFALTAYDELTIAAALVPDPVNDRRSAIAYDAGGRQAYTVRELGDGSVNKYVVTKHVYDALRQLVQRIEYVVPVTLMQFDKASIDAAVQRYLDRTTTYVHDPAERLRFEIHPDASFRESVYGAVNQVAQTRQFDFHVDGSREGLLRSEAEMVTLRGTRVVGDGATRGQAHTYDAAGRLTSTVDALNNPERYEYDAFGNRTRWIDKNGDGWTYQYDRTGQKVKETSPSATFKLSGEPLATPAPNRVIETRFAHDAFGKLIQKTEAANFASDARTTNFLYDTMGRLLSTRDHGYYDADSGRVERSPAANRFRREVATVYDTLGNAVRTSIRTGVNAF